MDSIEDTTQQQLKAVAEGSVVDSKVAADLKKRKLVVPESWTTFRLSKGPNFALEKKKAPTDLTADMLQKCARPQSSETGPRRCRTPQHIAHSAEGLTKVCSAEARGAGAASRSTTTQPWDCPQPAAISTLY